MTNEYPLNNTEISENFDRQYSKYDFIELERDFIIASEMMSQGKKGNPMNYKEAFNIANREIKQDRKERQSNKELSDLTN